MSIEAMQWVSDVTVGKGTDKAVLIALCNFHHGKKQDCSPGIERISEFTELNRKTVMPALDRLREAGFIDFEKGNRKHRKYTLNFDVYSPKNGIKDKRDNSTNFGTISDDSKVPNTPPQSPNGGTIKADLIVPNTTSYSPKHDLLKSQRLDHEQDNRVNRDTPPVYPPTENDSDQFNLEQQAADQPPLTDIQKADMIIDKLNHITGKGYRHTESNRRPIIARLKEGYSGKDLVEVINNRAHLWLGSHMDTYLRPSTLFRPSNFESYLHDKSTSMPVANDPALTKARQESKRDPSSTRHRTLQDDLTDTSWATGSTG